MCNLATFQRFQLARRYSVSILEGKARPTSIHVRGRVTGLALKRDRLLRELGASTAFRNQDSTFPCKAWVTNAPMASAWRTQASTSCMHVDPPTAQVRFASERTLGYEWLTSVLATVLEGTSNQWPFWRRAMINQKLAASSLNKEMILRSRGWWQEDHG